MRTAKKWRHSRNRFALVALAFNLILAGGLQAERIIQDKYAAKLLSQYCGDCHSPDAAEGGFVIDEQRLHSRVLSNDLDVLESLEHAHQMITKGIMPPPDAEKIPARQKSRLSQWLDHHLMQRSPIGGTPLRRLSGREYANTVRAVFGFDQFQLPNSFPPDNESQGFDNLGGSLVMAGSHLEAFSEIATAIADQLIPPAMPPAKKRVVRVPAKELVVSYSSAMMVENAMRLASSGENVVRNATWPSKFEAPVNGIYEIRVQLSSYVPSSFTPTSVSIETPMLHAQSTLTTGKGIEKTASATVEPGKQRTVVFRLGIDQGGTVQLRYANGPFNYDNKTEFADFIAALFESNPNLAMAWNKVGSPPRGGSGWDRVKEALATLGESDSLTASEVEKLAARVAKDSVKTGETLVYKYFEEGPYLAIESLTITGPLSEYDNKEQLQSERQRSQFFAKHGYDQTVESLDAFFGSFLFDLFRRPATADELTKYVRVATQEFDASGSLEQGLHLSIRTALLSPSFLYRAIGTGVMADFELASRLSYCFTSRPPDATLSELAKNGSLSKQSILREQINRLMDNEYFAADFTSQWLQLDSLEQLMPDKRLIRKFTSDHRAGMKDEVVESFRHVVSENLPLKDLIAPDFVFTNQSVGKDIYELPSFKGKSKGKRGKPKMAKIPVDRNGWRGGLLTMPAIMMATANGVDTQPVLRGVWVLNNILGSPPPEPPKAVPALTPDTQGASSPKDRLAAHMAEESCAICHREIDPLGFALESFDAIGRWREFYPNSTNKKQKLKVDTSGRLPGGVEITGVVDLKRWLADDPTPFAICLSEKFLTYATGRTLNYRERSMVKDIVLGHSENDFRMRDLIESLVLSEIFRTK